MNKITYGDKVDTRVTSDPEINKVTASTLNEVKTITNETVDQVESNITDIATNTTDIATNVTAIALNTSKVTDSGTPALLSNGSLPSFNTGMDSTKIRQLIGAGTGDGTSDLVLVLQK